MNRIFIINDGIKDVCVATSNQTYADKLQKSGVYELPEAKIKEFFGEYDYLVSPLTAKVIDRDNIIFTKPEMPDFRYESLRTERDRRISTVDKAIMQLQRQLRITTEENREDIENRLGVWDAYAEALCDLPSQPGAPWDGGGPETPWPEPPAMPVKNI